MSQPDLSTVYILDSQCDVEKLTEPPLAVLTSDCSIILVYFRMPLFEYLICYMFPWHGWVAETVPANVHQWLDDESISIVLLLAGDWVSVVIRV